MVRHFGIARTPEEMDDLEGCPSVTVEEALMRASENMVHVMSKKDSRKTKGAKKVK
jgi:hypothetical protein